MTKDTLSPFVSRHVGPNAAEQEKMLETLGVKNLGDLIDNTIPKAIRDHLPDNFPEGLDEHSLIRHLKDLMGKNMAFKSFIGLGYYGCHVPAVIQRSIFENPGWYTQYTPYQAEISQGRLEALFYFQTMVCDMTKMAIANASLLDEGTAAAEAMLMLHRARPKAKVADNANVFFVSETCFPQTIALLQTRATPLGITLDIGPHQKVNWGKKHFGAFLQYPDANGQCSSYDAWVTNAHNQDIQVAVAADLLSLALLKPPGDWDADVVVGSTQRFGVPIGYGGPHAAYVAAKKSYQRLIPGRIIGLSKDKHGQPAYRMAIQTREQHIRREKATSNICTAQALLAIMATMYAIYHGPKGIKEIATNIHHLAKQLADGLKALGYDQANSCFFDTLTVPVGESDRHAILDACEAHKINLRTDQHKQVGISLDETSTKDDIALLLSIFAKAKDQTGTSLKTNATSGSTVIPSYLNRQSPFLTDLIFNQYHSETNMMRYIKQLENKDLSLTHSMIALGSCTMKLNAATEMQALSWESVSNIHPFVPKTQAQGYQTLIKKFESQLCTLTGFSACSLQPNSGAQGEYAGLMVIREYHLDRGDKGRSVILIPSSAHGTNPASAALLGMGIVVIKCDASGNIDVADLKEKAIKHKDKLAGLMITYPSTHGVFEESIQEICDLIHQNGGLVYMDGANMNAQVGLTTPAKVGADVCHLNLHKTFSIPHGGGGPGMGPICVAPHLAPYLPSHPLFPSQSEKNIGPVSAAPYGSASILLISYAYIMLLGKTGVTQASQVAILNANYLRVRLAPHYTILYAGKNGNVAHELIIDLRDFKKFVTVEDVAKRLMDYGFHAPTMSWPVPGTLMIEPTESESKAELDRFCDAMIAIRLEINDIELGKSDPVDNVLKNAPHTTTEVMSDTWSHTYNRETAAFPLPFVRDRKFWPSVSRIDNAYGDRHLICSCPTIEELATAV